jgi:hypothetical protein
MWLYIRVQSTSLTSIIAITSNEVFMFLLNVLFENDWQFEDSDDNIQSKIYR